MAHRKGRSALTAGGIVLGVAILFGVLVANATTQEGVDRLIEDFTGRADIVAGAPGAFDATFGSDVLDRLRALPDVEVVVGGFGFPSTVRANDEAAEVQVSGIDPGEAPRILDYELADGRLFDPGERRGALPEELAETLGIGPGDTLEVGTPDGPSPLTVVGVLTDTGAGRTNNGDIVYTSLPAARELAGKNGFTGASVILDEGIDPDPWIDAHRDDLAGVVTLRNADTLAEGFKTFLSVFGGVLTFFAAIALFVGAFLIYLTLSMAVIERTRTYGTLRALGATRRQVRRLVIAEALALGTASTLVGLGVGIAVAKGLLVLMSNLFGLDLPGLAVPPGALIAGVVVGLGITLTSALLPARRAGRLAPVTAMKGDYASELRIGRAWIAGAVILVASLAVQFAGAGRLPQALDSLTTLGVLLGAVLLVPLLLRPLAAALGKLTGRIAPGVGDIAVLHLVKERSRSAYTLALVMVVMAMLLTTGGLFLSVRSGIDDLIERQFGADLSVGSDAPLPDGFAERLRARDDVAQVSPIWFGQTQAIGADGDREELFVQIVEPESYFALSGFLWVDGDDERARRALTRGGAILLSEPTAETLGVQPGGSVRIETSEGPTTFTVEGTYAAPPGPPTVTIAIDDGRRALGAERPFVYRADVVDGADPEVVADELEAAYGERFALQVATLGDAKEDAVSDVSQYFQIIYAILGVAALVGLLGLANTLAMSVLRRFREIGILRSLGVTRGQVWRMVLTESATMGLVAFVLSVPLGFVLTTLVVAGMREGFGFEMPTTYPWTWLPIVFGFGVVVAVVAALAPGRRAARLEVVGALQYE